MIILQSASLVPRKEKRLSRQAILLRSGAKAKAKFVYKGWAGIEQTHLSLPVKHNNQPQPMPVIAANVEQFRDDFFVNARYVFGCIQTNAKHEPKSNSYHYFCVDYKNACECIQVDSKVCVWCGQKPCN
jgi:hypothetical protein